MQLVDKVLAYITRHRDGRQQLLVFDHRGIPDAGTQVPAGTIETNEKIENALWREIEEESGLGRDQLRLRGKIAEHESLSWRTRRHVFHLEVQALLPDTWTWIVEGAGEDRGFVFDYRWVNLEVGLELAGEQHIHLRFIACT